MDSQKLNCNICISNVRPSSPDLLFNKEKVVFDYLIVSLQEKQILYMGQKLKKLFPVYKNISSSSLSPGFSFETDNLIKVSEPVGGEVFSSLFVLKFQEKEILRKKAFIQVLETDEHEHPNVCNIFLTRYSEVKAHKKVDVTKRELEVLKLVAQGQSAKQVAAGLHISVHTAVSHKKNLIQKFKVKNTAELIMEASNKAYI